MSRLTLAEQIAQLDDTTPMDVDPEDVYGERRATREEAGSDAENIGDVSRSGREHYVEVGPSHLRKLHDSTDDPKYAGRKTTRSQIFDDDGDQTGSGDENESDSSVDDYDELQHDSQGHSEVDSTALPEDKAGSEDDTGVESADEDNEEPFHSHKAQKDASPRYQSPEMEVDAGLADGLKKTREQDRIKGKAITRQQALWDTLLDARIRLQKASQGANKLPLPDDIGPYVVTDTCRKAANQLLEETLQLSEALFQLEEILLSRNDTIKLPPRKRRRVDNVDNLIDIDYEPQIMDATAELSLVESAYHPVLIQTLNRWSAKVQAVAPTTLSSANSFSRSSKSNSIKGAVQLIAETVDEGKAVARTKIRRSGKPLDRIGAKAPEGEQELSGETMEEGNEVFDDVDFYQQLLRDIIDSRSGKEGSSLLEGDAWSLKPKKSKRKTDSRESKGRRLRYEVHEKLQNFMVPIPVKGAWHEEQIDELFASLMGKGFEGTGSEAVKQPLDHSVPDDELTKIFNGGLGGLRVF